MEPAEKETMPVMPFGYQVKVLDEETGRTKTVHRYIDLRYRPQDFTLYEWAEIEGATNTCPPYIAVALGLRTKGDFTEDEYNPATDTIMNWTAARFGEYRDFLLRILRTTATKETRRNIKDLQTTGDSSFEECELLVPRVRAILNMNCALRKEQMREHFTHKGRRFVVPYDNQLYGNLLTWGEATEALESNNDYRNPKKVRDASAYRTNSAYIIAAMTREVLDYNNSTGTYKEEERPTSVQAWQAHIRERMAFFADLPMDIVHNVCFFLQVSFKSYNPTHYTALLLQNSLPAYATILQIQNAGSQP